jgi:hypothetical protein
MVSSLKDLYSSVLKSKSGVITFSTFNAENFNTPSLGLESTTTMGLLYPAWDSRNSDIGTVYTHSVAKSSIESLESAVVNVDRSSNFRFGEECSDGDARGPEDTSTVINIINGLSNS